MSVEQVLVEVCDLAVQRGGATLLSQVNLAVRAGEIVTLVGPNGGGKSTLLHVVLGLLQPTSGRVHRHDSLRPGFVPQRLFVEPTLPLRVRDFLALSAARAFPDPEMITRLRCAPLLDKPVQSLSGGELQRVMLSRALLNQPNFLVLDEPAQGVDAEGVREIHQLIETLREERALGVLMVSHDLHMVMASTNHVICINRHVCCSGTPTAVSGDPAFRSLFGEKHSGFGFYRHDHDHRHRL